MKKGMPSAFAMAIILGVGLACSSFTSSKPSENTAKPVVTPETANKKSPENSTIPKVDNSNVEKADFTVTSEEFDKEFTKKGAKEDDLKNTPVKISLFLEEFL